MARFILASLMVAISTLPMYAQSSTLHTDRSGYTTGSDGNRTVNTYTDQYGNTTDWVGGKYISRDLPRPGRGPDHDQDESYVEAGRVDRAVQKMRAAVQKNDRCLGRLSNAETTA